MMARMSRVAVLIGLLSCAAPAVVAAQEVDHDEEARNLNAAGRSAFDDGRFEEALEYFERAHELSGRSMILFNIGSALDRLRRDPEAADAYREYLDRVPSAPNRAEVEARLAAIERALATGDGTGTGGGTETGTGTGTGTGTMTGDGTESGTGVGAGPVLSLAGAAASGVIAGALFARARAADDDLQVLCALGCTRAQIDDSGGPRLQNASRAMLAVSLAAALVGATWLVVRLTRRPAVDVAVGPAGARLVVALR